MTDMEQVIERVADAVLSDLMGRRGIRQELEAIEDADPEIWDEIRQAIGRLAILATLRGIREPSEGMVLDGAHAASGWASGRNKACNGYRTMIDRAISDLEQGKGAAGHG